MVCSWHSSSGAGSLRVRRGGFLEWDPYGRHCWVYPRAHGRCTGGWVLPRRSPASFYGLSVRGRVSIGLRAVKGSLGSPTCAHAGCLGLGQGLWELCRQCFLVYLACFLRLEPGGGGPGLLPPVEGRGRRSSGGSSGEYSFFVLDFASGPGLLISAIMAPSNKSVGRAFARPTDVSSDSAGTMVGGVVLDEASEASWSLKVVCSARRISRAFPLLRFPRLLFFSAGENNRVARMVNFSQRGFPPAPVGLPVYLSPGSGPFHFSSGRKEIYLPCQVFCRHGVVPAQAHGGLLCDEANGSEPRWVAIEETVFGFRTSSSVLDGVILADRQGGRMTPRSGVAVSPWF